MSTPSMPPAPPAAEGRQRRWVAAGAVTGLVAVLWPLGFWGGRYEVVALDRLAAAAPTTGAGSAEPSRDRAAALRRRLAAQVPAGTYALIDTFHNRLYVRRGGELLREAVCSTGSGVVLRHRDSGQEWVFDTPLGERRVERKARDPVWIKPDWAFIEEGFEPPADLGERMDDVSLGDYGIYLGDGYLIHGTLFKSLLGQKITHGCIRLGEDDLEYLYRALRVGDRVLLY